MCEAFSLKNIELNIESAAGAWKVTTGLNLSVIATGRFTA